MREHAEEDFEKDKDVQKSYKREYQLMLEDKELFPQYMELLFDYSLMPGVKRWKYVDEKQRQASSSSITLIALRLIKEYQNPPKSNKTITGIKWRILLVGLAAFRDQVHTSSISTLQKLVNGFSSKKSASNSKSLSPSPSSEGKEMCLWKEIEEWWSMGNPEFVMLYEKIVGKSFASISKDARRSSGEIGAFPDNEMTFGDRINNQSISMDSLYQQLKITGETQIKKSNDYSMSTAANISNPSIKESAALSRESHACDSYQDKPQLLKKPQPPPSKQQQQEPQTLESSFSPECTLPDDVRDVLIAHIKVYL